jgi:hypothetical protein
MKLQCTQISVITANLALPAGFFDKPLLCTATPSGDIGPTTFHAAIGAAVLQHKPCSTMSGALPFDVTLATPLCFSRLSPSRSSSGLESIALQPVPDGRDVSVHQLCHFFKR